MENILKKLKNNIEKIQRYNFHRKIWLMASVCIIAIMLGIMLKWEYIIHSKILWVLTIFGMTVTAAWWYWTMAFIRQMITVKAEESVILLTLLQDVHYVHKEILKTLNQNSK